jgi:predicted RNA-binding Zn-ribbon protein involved in translation (DUF1610 family)
VHEAVSKRTVLPAHYTIPENIGDRISRLTTPKPVNFVLISPKIPQVDSDWTSTPTLEPQPIKADSKESIEDAYLEAPALARGVDEAPLIPQTPEAEPVVVKETLSNNSTTVVDEAPSIPQTPEAEPVAVEEILSNDSTTAVDEAPSIPQTPEAEPVAVEEILSNDSTTIVDEAPSIPQTPEAEPVAVEEILSNDSTTAVDEAPSIPQTSEAEPVVIEEILHNDSTTAVDEAPSIPQTPEAEPVVVEEILSNDSTTVVDEAPLIPQTPEENIVAVVAEPVEVEEIPEEDSVAVIAEPIEVKDTPNETLDNNTPTDLVTESVALTETTSDKISDTNTPLAEEEDTQAPTLLERVSSVIETVSKAFQNPDTEQKDAEAVGEPAQLDAAASEAPVADTSIEPSTTEAAADEVEEVQTPTLLERVSAVVEAASKAFQNLDTEQEDAEAVGEPADLDTRPSEAPVADTTIEPSRTDAAADEIEDAPAPTLLEQVSTPDEAVSTPLKDSDADKKNSETVIEPAPAEAQKVSDSKTLEVTCPKCESTDLRKNGRRQGKQRYICKDCGRQFVMPDSAEVEDKPKDKAISPVETSKAKASGSDTSISNSTSGSSKHQSKKKTKAKGFGSRKAK